MGRLAEITLVSKILFPRSIFDKLRCWIINSYLTTECGKIFTPSARSLAYYYGKDTYCKGSLNKVKS